ncbi:hypothetical protein K1719_025659 [Acacia pycnantha]|nr:hypothetical protein K1719_025659 [Acacia pycnantha]
MGLAPHKDTSIVTFLHQTQIEVKIGSEIRTEDQTCRLQIFKDRISTWVQVHLDPDVFVVNVGVVFDILSNRRFKYVPHRVTISRTAHQYSYAYFHRPCTETLISPFAPPPHFRAHYEGI